MLIVYHSERKRMIIVNNERWYNAILVNSHHNTLARKVVITWLPYIIGEISYENVLVETLTNHHTPKAY